MYHFNFGDYYYCNLDKYLLYRTIHHQLAILYMQMSKVHVISDNVL